MVDLARPHVFLMLRVLALLALPSIFHVRSQIIYDNTAHYLSNYVAETREYGDQLDLGGTARRLTQIQFEYFARFATNGDEAVKVRLYTNEQTYDLYRKSPTTLIYESDWLPISPGFQRRLIDGLNVLLPLHTVTFTAQFRGISASEEAGLLFYGPPTEGYSFNEFWMREANGNWSSVLYSNTDPLKRANVGLRLIAVPDIVSDQRQPGATKQLALRKGANNVRFAQTFTSEVTGFVSQIIVNTTFSNAPIRLRILDTIDGCPGPHVLGTRNILAGNGTNQTIAFLSASVFLQKSKRYALEFSTTAPATTDPTYLIAAATNNYPRGELWFRNEEGGLWTPVSNAKLGLNAVDAAFEVLVVPAQPNVELTSPRPSESFDSGEPIVLRAQNRPPEIGSITRMRFFSGIQEIGSATTAPYVFTWTNATAGEHQLRAIAEDSFRRPFRSAITVVNVRPAGPPDNDFFSSRMPLDGLNLRRMKPTLSASIEGGEPILRTNTPANATVWWSWTAYDATPVTISAQNSSRLGAEVAVFKGTNLTTLQRVTNGTTLVRFRPEPGVAYAISVDPVSRGDLAVLDLATADVRLEPLHTNVLKANQSFTFGVTGPRAGSITNVDVFLGPEVLARGVSAPRRWTNTIARNGFYALHVIATDSRGIETISDPLPLTVRPQNDTFEDRILLQADKPATLFYAGAGTIDQEEPPLPNLGYSERGSTWWTWIAPASGRILTQIKSEGAGAALAVYFGTNISNIALVAQNAGTGILTFDAIAGRTYQIRVVGNFLDTEPLLLSLTGDWVRLNATTSPSGDVILSFDATIEPAANLQVEYSSDLVTWKPAGTRIIEDRVRFTWRDAGPPATERHPNDVKTRFYRIVRE